MKKCICLVLALMVCLSAVSVMASAETATVNIKIDGVKDTAYTENMSIQSDYWLCQQNNAIYEPVDFERNINTLYFNWDDDFIYCYLVVETSEKLYKPDEGVDRAAADKAGDYYQKISIYMDTAPSVSRTSPKCQATGAACTHFYCNCNEGDAKYYRLQTRVAPAWDTWWNYYRSDEGMFLTFEQFMEKRMGEDGYGDIEAMYLKENGACEAVSFIDYDTNTYGAEWKYPRAEGEEHFLVNTISEVTDYDWGGDIGPELSYNYSANVGHWLNFDGMFDVWFADYEGEDPEVVAVQRLIASIPDVITEENLNDAKTVLQNAQYKYSMLDEAQAAQITQGELDKMALASAYIEVIIFSQEVGDVDYSGAVNAGDALVALRIAVGKLEVGSEAMLLADVNGDDKVDAGDALDMLKFAVGKLDEFAVVTQMKALLGR